MKSFFLTGATMLASGVLMAQSFYGELGVQVNSASNKSIISENISARLDMLTLKLTEEHEQVIGSYGAGTAFSATLGYGINKHFAVELEALYLNSSVITTNNNFNWVGQFEDNYKRERHASYFSVTPTAVLRAPTGRIRPFASFGVVLALPQLTYEDEGVFEVEDDESLTWEFKSRLTTGYNIAAGVVFQAFKQVGFTASLGFTNLTYVPEEVELTKFQRGDENALQTLSEAQRNDTFSETYKEVYDIDFATGETTREEEELINIDDPGSREPFSSFNIGIGVRYTFGKS